VKLAKPEKVVCSKMGKKVMGRYHPESENWPVEAMTTGDTLDLGGRTAQFLEMKMVHWPDSMAAYIPENKVLITNDAFGQNWAASERWSDQVDRSLLKEKMSEYWANIINPFAGNVKKVLDAIEEQNLDIDMIFPDHGFMFRGEECKFAVDTYKEYVEEKPSNRAIVFYDTMWHSTEKMARAVAEGLADEGVSVRVMHLKSFHHSDVQSEIFKAGAVCVGSPTHNNGILPLVSNMLTYMKGLKPKNKVGAAFGSYGWSGESVKVLTQWLTDMKLDVVEGVRANYAPGEELEACVDLGRRVGQELKAKL
jgi:flavorubredoxin